MATSATHHHKRADHHMREAHKHLKAAHDAVTKGHGAERPTTRKRAARKEPRAKTGRFD